MPTLGAEQSGKSPVEKETGTQETLTTPAPFTGRVAKVELSKANGIRIASIINPWHIYFNVIEMGVSYM